MKWTIAAFGEASVSLDRAVNQLDSDERLHVEDAGWGRERDGETDRHWFFFPPITKTYTQQICHHHDKCCIMRCLCLLVCLRRPLGRMPFLKTPSHTQSQRWDPKRNKSDDTRTEAILFFFFFFFLNIHRPTCKRTVFCPGPSRFSSTWLVAWKRNKALGDCSLPK